MKRYRDIAGDGGSGIIEQVTEKLTNLDERMKGIKRTIAVMSGKGGVGKSTITVSLAGSMARQGLKVGILDADLNGPSIPKMTGIENVRLESTEDGIIPPSGVFGIKVMSMELFLSNKDAPVTWDGPSATYPWISAIEATALRELLADTVWGEMDILLIDLPPVLSRFNDLAGLLPGLNGVVIVTIPSEISHRIVLKSINRVKELNIPILGLIENMKGYKCIHCGKDNSLFAEEDMEDAFGYLHVPYLGRVPFDKGLSLLSENSLTHYIKEGASLPLSDVFDEIGKKVLRSINLRRGT